MSSQETDHVFPTEVTPELGKGAQDTWRPPRPCGGRLDKTGVTPRQLRRRGRRQTRTAGVYTDQRLNLSKLGKAFERKPRFQTGSVRINSGKGCSDAQSPI